MQQGSRFRCLLLDLIILLKQPPTFLYLLKHPACFFAFGFGSGLAKKAPGTWGTLSALPLTYLAFWFGLAPMVLALICIPLFLIGIYFCAVAEKALGVCDYGGVVWDEIVAMMLILCFVPFTWSWWSAAFVTFRFFDILKPWPIRYFDQQMQNALGVMMDDLLAAIASIAVLYGVGWLVSFI